MSTPSFMLESLEQVEETAEQGIWIGILDPRGRPLRLGKQHQNFRVRVAGTLSRTFRAAQKELRDAVLNGKLADLGIPEGDEDAKDRWLLARCTLEWEAAFDDHGTPVPLSVPNAMLIYAAGRFVYNQVDAGMWSTDRFFPDSSDEQ